MSVVDDESAIRFIDCIEIEFVILHSLFQSDPFVLSCAATISVDFKVI